VKERGGEALLTKVMRAGEAWPVPDRGNLILNTGNAGRVEILVDGAEVPSIGGPGSVRKDVPLDPDLLKAGPVIPGCRASLTICPGKPACDSVVSDNSVPGGAAPAHLSSAVRRQSGYILWPVSRVSTQFRSLRMNYRPYQEIHRRTSRRVYVGKVPVGDGAPISVQTMTNTLTTDVAGTVAQIRRAEAAGVDIVRVSCPDQPSALALKDIVAQVSVPIVADIHFHYHRRAIEAAESGAACLRINPGNIGSDERVKEW